MRRRPQDPHYMRKKTLKDGTPAWFFEPPTWARKANCPVKAESLGTDEEAAAARVRSLLYPAFRSWCTGGKIPKTLQLDPRAGTLTWMFERYYHTRAFEKVDDKTKRSYRALLTGLETLKMKSGGALGDLQVADITPRLADAAYGKLLNGPGGKRYRTANYTVDIARLAWRTTRASEETRALLKKMAQHFGQDQTAVIVRAIDQLAASVPGLQERKQWPEQ
jgi:hypothetical protein